MGRKKVLEKRLARLQNKINELTARSQAEDVTLEELRRIQFRMNEIREDMADVQEEIADIADEPGEPTPTPQPQPQLGEGEQRSIPPQGAGVVNGGIIDGVLGSFPQNQQRNNDPYATMEYRTAFMNFVQRGTPIPQNLTTRAGGDPGTTSAAELGAIIPTTIMNEFIKDVSKVYGQIYSKVRKLNVQGGVKFPISKLKAKFTWITETTVSEKQKAGDINEFIEFSYNIGEIRVAQSLLSSIVSLSLFEQEVVRIMVAAYVETMDKAIVLGTGTGQPLGLLKDPRVTGNTGHTIEFTAAEFSDWEAWRKKLFAKIPLSRRGKGEFMFAASTVESNLLTMKDGNNRPIFREATGLEVAENATDGRFFGRTVMMVEPDIVADFDTAAGGDVVGVYWVPEDYAINTNLAFGMKRYFDEDTNEWINKGLTIVDGKMLDVNNCYIIKKKV